MSPTVFRHKGYRFYFFSREEPRMHIHVRSAEGEAKFWIDPSIELATCAGLTPKALATIEGLIRDHYDVIREAWNEHFRR